MIESINKEKNILDEKADQSRYAYLISRKDYYEKLIQSIEEMNGKMIKCLNETDIKFEAILNINSDCDLMKDSVSGLVSNCFKIDGKRINFNNKLKKE
jgi:hypothetical protein